MTDQQIYRIMYQGVTRTQDGVNVINQNPEFYRDEPMPRERFVDLTKQLFARHENNLEAVMEDLVRNHGFRYAPNIVARVQLNPEGKIDIK